MQKTRSFILIFLVTMLLMSACQKALTAQQVWDQAFTKMQGLTTVLSRGELSVRIAGEEASRIQMNYEGAHEPQGRSLLTIESEAETMHIYQFTEDYFYGGWGSLEDVVWGMANFKGSVLGFYLFPSLTPFSDTYKASWGTPVMVGEEEVEGVLCYHITLTANPEAYMSFLLKGLLIAHLGYESMTLIGTADYYIGKKDLYIYRSTTNVEMIVVTLYGGGDPQSFYINTRSDFSNWNEPYDFPIP